MNLYVEEKKPQWILLELILKILMYAVSLTLAATIFKGIYISSFWYAIVASIVVTVLNATVKPFLKFLTLPITFVTLGLFYPFIDVMILKLASSLIGSDFIIKGWIVPFFIALFVSIVTIILDGLITKKIVGDLK